MSQQSSTLAPQGAEILIVSSIIIILPKFVINT
jgi:hypothetical protein